MKKGHADTGHSLEEAHAAITAELKPLPEEQVPLAQALGRVSAETIFADHAEPAYSQATRDGFVIAGKPCSFDNAFAQFQIRGERAAGCTEQQGLPPGQADRIMTGAMLPRNAVRVVPFEVCQEEGSTLSVPEKVLHQEQLYIRPQGKDVKQGECLVKAGIRLNSDYLLILAENGSQQVRVHRRPRVAVICTGSELIRSGKSPLPGQKISSNELLLDSLLQEQGCCLVRATRVQDTLTAIVEQVQAILEQDKPDILISTGGTGPGKFDLMEQAVTCLQGSPRYNLLKIRPGKSTLFALINNTPLFALPGPPPAVRLLFHELIVPGLSCLQGLANTQFTFAGLVDAVLTEPVGLCRTGYLALKTAKATLSDGQLQVRLTKRQEPMNAIMHLSCPDDGHGGSGEVKRNQLVKVRLIRPLGSNL